MSMALGRVCTACGAERKKKSIKYDPNTLLPYCEHPYVCNEDHPNSPKNMLARNSELKLLSFEEAQEHLMRWLETNQPTRERAEKIQRMVTQPITVRIKSVDLAIFLFDLQEEFQFPTVSDAIRYCIQTMLDSKGKFYADYAKLSEEKAEVKRIEQTKAEVQKELEKNPFDVEEQEEEEIVL